MVITNQPEKEFKVMFIKMLTEFGRTVGRTQWELQQRDRKCKKIPNQSHRAEQYNSWTENHTRGIQ